MGDAKVIFDLRRGVISVEGNTADLGKLFEAVRAAAPSFKEIRIVSGEGSNRAAQSSTSGERPSSMHDFARRFSFNNTYERIAALAYYALKYQAKAQFSAKDMINWFTLCGFKQPSQMPVALSDAKRKYEYIENKGRGQWVLAVDGENLVREMAEAI